MKHWPIKRVILLALGLAAGALSGYAYWYFIGCNSGSCLITATATNSTIYGLVMGGLLAESIWDYVNRKNKKVEQKS